MKMFLSQGQSYRMTVEVFMVHSQLSRTMLLDILMNSPFLCLPFDYFIARAPPIASLADGMVGCGFTSSSFKRQVEGLLELEP